MSGTSISTTFLYDFSWKMFLVLHYINWPNLFTIAFTSRDIGQYVYQNYLLTRLWRHNIWNQSNHFCYMTKKSWQKLKYVENEKSFWGEIKNIFHYF